MKLVPYFKDRSNGARLTPQAAWQAEGCSWSVAAGGCAEAVLRARVNWANAAELAELLRCGLELYDESGGVAWWGLVETVTVRQGSTGGRLTLDGLANRVRVSFESSGSTLRGGGTRCTTGWVDDPESQAVFGVRERQVELEAATPAQAEAYRAAQLGKLSKLRVLPVLCGIVEGIELELHAVGWFETLGWKHYASSAGLVEYTGEGRGVQPVGDAAAHTRVAQGFTTGTGGWSAGEAWVNARRQGSPADALRCELCADASGVPGSVLASASLAGAAVREDFAWVRFTLESAAALAANTPYWLVFSRSGGSNASAYYRLRMNESLGYAGGELRLWGGASWAARSPDADLLFRVAGTVETTTQAAAAASAAEGGQFLSGVRLDAVSGIYTNPYRSGDKTALEEITAHLRAGTTDGVELLPFVTPERVLVIYARPEESTAVYRMDALGNLLTASGAEAAGCMAAQLVGQWAVMDAPWAAMASKRMWLERLRWEADDGQVRVG